MTECGILNAEFLDFAGSKIPKSAFRNPQSCLAPVSLNSLNETSTTAELTWSPISSEIAWDLEIRPSGQPFNGIPTTDSLTAIPFIVNGLQPGTQYKFKVRAHCPDGSLSPWSTTQLFRTRLTNPSPCAMNLMLADTSCTPFFNHFLIENNAAPGLVLGTDVILKSVKLILFHEWVSDLEMWLVSPAGQRVLLVSQAGGSGNHFGNPANSTCLQVCELTSPEFCGNAPISTGQAPFLGAWDAAGDFSDFNDGSSPLGIWTLEICDLTTDDLGILKFVELEFAAPNCLPPTQIATTVVSSTSVGLTWTNPAPCADSLLIEYGPAGFLPGNGAAAGQGILKMVACNAAQPCELTGLQALTSYDVFLRKRCDSMSYSFNSCRKTFFTDCISPTLVETFNGQTGDTTLCSGNAWPSPITGFWKNETGDNWDFRLWKNNTPSGGTGPDDDITGGGKYLYIETSCAGGVPNIQGKKAILSSRCALIHAAGPCSMSFNWHLFGINIGSLKLEISTDAGQNWSPIFQKTGNQGNGWHREFIDLSPFDGLIANFRFTATGGNGPLGDLALDDIRFFGSTDAGAPDYVFFKDLDSDGFGNAAAPISSCSPLLPPGFSENSLDCDDSNGAINPNAAEILCNSTDENCNGFADDPILNAPTVGQPVEICSGNSATLLANGQPAGQFYWFDSPTGGNLLGTGNALTLNGLIVPKTVWAVDSIFNSGQNMGCASPRTSAQIQVFQTPKLAILGSPEICRGDEFDLASLTVIDSANAGGTISWHTGLPTNPSNKLASPVVSPAVSTSYVAVSTTPFGCSDEKMIALTVHQLPTATIAQGDSVALCRAEQSLLSGYATGNGPFTFSWSGGSLAGLWNFYALPITGSPQAGFQTYFLETKDANGCLDTAEMVVSTAASISSMQLDSIKNATFCGGFDGKIKLTPLNGLAPFSFEWDGPQPGSLPNQPSGQATILGLGQGSYQITVVDSSPEGCSMVLPAQVINAPGLAVEIDSIFEISCPAGHDGRIELALSDSQNPTFLWSNGSTSQHLAGVGPGQFSVTITDGGCQQKLKNLPIKQPDSFLFLPNLLENVTCNGSANGKIDLLVSGGTPFPTGSEYAFLWTNGQTVEDPGPLGPGPFRTTLTDARGCSAISPWFTISEPPALVVFADSIHPITCANGSDGAIFLQATGGNGPGFQFSWNGGPSAAPFLTGLPGGFFGVTATDLAGCTGSAAFDLTAPPPLTYFQIQAKPPTCVGLDDGILWLNGWGGVPPYLYAWSNGADSARLENLPPGQLSLTLTDARGCVFSTTNLMLVAPQVIDFQLDTLKNVRCFGDLNGQISGSISGGTGPISVIWNDSIFSQNLQNVAAGFYSAVILDSIGCRFETPPMEVGGPTGPLTATIVSQENATCFGLADGSIDLEISGGTAPFSPVWNDSLAQEDLSNLSLGYWNLQVTDANGCATGIDNIVVGQPSEIYGNATVGQIPCVGSALGSIELQPTGGFDGYFVAWNTGDSTAAIYQLLPGFYTATITDIIGCTAEMKPIQIYSSSLDFSAQVIDFQPIDCFGNGNGTASATFTGGTPPFEIAWKNGLLTTSASQSISIQNLPVGPVWLTVLDDAGCLAFSDTIFIEEPAALYGFYENWLAPPCFGETGGHIFPNLTGGVLPYSFAWSEATSGQISILKDLEHIGAGIYQLSMEDLNGCPFEFPELVLTQPGSPISLEIDSIRHDNCNNQSGFLEIHATGGVPNYSYEWANGQIGPTNENLGPGPQTLFVMDDSLCLKSFFMEILANANPIQAAIDDFVNVLCWGDSTGELSVVASGGTPPYSILWSTGSMSDSIFGLPKANYFVTVSDATGCEFTVGAVLMQPSLPIQVDSLAVQPTAAGLSNGSICLFLSGGNGLSYSFLWSNGQTGSCLFGLPTGWFSATATDANGCEIFVDSIFVDEFVATGEPSILTKMSLWPNPVSERLFVELETTQLIDCEWNIVDLTGRAWPVFGANTELSAGRHRLEIGVGELPAGAWFLKMTTVEGVVARRFLVAR